MGEGIDVVDDEGERQCRQECIQVRAIILMLFKLVASFRLQLEMLKTLRLHRSFQMRAM